MDTRTLAKVWDHRASNGAATIGVNWSAVGPVKPDTARKFARRLFRAADTAERRIYDAKKRGHHIVDPEQLGRGI